MNISEYSPCKISSAYTSIIISPLVPPIMIRFGNNYLLEVSNRGSLIKRVMCADPEIASFKTTALASEKELSLYTSEDFESLRTSTNLGLGTLNPCSARSFR